MLKKSYRLSKRGSFSYVYHKGERKSDNLVGLVWVRGRNLRVGFSVPNKVGKAVVRNKVKRRLRAAVRELLPSIAPAQIVFTAKAGAQALSYQQIHNSVRGLLVRARLISSH